MSAIVLHRDLRRSLSPFFSEPQRFSCLSSRSESYIVLAALAVVIILQAMTLHILNVIAKIDVRADLSTPIKKVEHGIAGFLKKEAQKTDSWGNNSRLAPSTESDNCQHVGRNKEENGGKKKKRIAISS